MSRHPARRAGTCEQKEGRLRHLLLEMDSTLIAFSGGVDSSFLVAVAHEVLGERAIAVTALSPAIPAVEVEEARRLAARLGVRHLVVETKEMDSPAYVQNSPDRCFHCKSELFDRLRSLAADLQLACVADGSNADDERDFRPGRRAAAAHDVRSPLAEAGLTKDEIRLLSKARGLPTWDKPAMACLASRLPYGMPVTAAALEQVEAAEAVLRALGLRQLRVRHHGNIARIEVDEAGFALLTQDGTRHAVTEKLKALGYLYVTLDLAGFRSGSLNEALPITSAGKRDAT
ncbi:MAG: ATP-dependent sacrificial sulfur transferase LarE [Dehalococcoidia bacterium]